MANYYVDTRGNRTEADKIPFSEAVLEGIAPGGGLYVPARIPHFALDEIVALGSLPYAKRAARIIGAFEPDLAEEALEDLLEDAYGAQWDDEAICPITSFDDGLHVLELWHGPTSAFKDMALQCLPRFFRAILTMRAEAAPEGVDDAQASGLEYMILVATSGDTGKAALAGFQDVDLVSIGVLYPDGGVSDIQFKQMATQRGGNVQVWGVRGNFDDCQTGVKAVFGDEAYNERLAAGSPEAGGLDGKRVVLSSANSINWGRLIPQICYYVSGYAQLVADGAIEAGDPIDVCVPTGNFGNILAAWYAREMGTPIRRLICASNVNRVLTDFIETGVYDISDRPFTLTPSPSMDILVSSNLERQLFELTGRDSEAVRGWMVDLRERRRFEVDAATFAKFQELYVGGSVDNAECLATIHEVFEERGYLLDPHTAVAWRVAAAAKTDAPVLIASTAHWAKFGANVYRALHGIAPGEELPAELAELTGCELNALLAREAGAKVGKEALGVPKGLAELDELPLRFTEVIDGDPASIEAAVWGFLER